MSLLRTASLTTLALALAAVPWVGTTSTATAQDGTVTMSGTAYEFNRVRTMLAGATIHVVEDPSLTATVAEDGTYELEVPDHSTVTPYIVKEGYGTIHLQTFTTDGQDLVNVNFQTPTAGVMAGLALILGIERNDAGYPKQCAVVATVSTKQVRGVSYENFITWGAHGVAGVTAEISPKVGTRTYFNESVLPDKSVTETTEDGGVVWTEVPPGEYTLTAKGAGSKWPRVQITCEDGRIVNANPPWGLNQLATTVPSKVTPTWKVRPGKAAKLTGLTVGRFPKQSLSEYAATHESTIDHRGRITVSCTGTGCFEPVTRRGSMKKPVDLIPLLGADARKLKAGRRLTVTLAVPGYHTRIDSWAIGANGKPVRSTRCIALGESLIAKTC